MGPSNILVTGGAGYIGSHVCKALKAAGYSPVVYDDLSRGNRWAVKWGPLEVGRLTDHERLTGVLRQYKPSAVLHFAAFAYVGESMANPLIYYQNNVVGSTALVAAMAETGIDQLVFSSTCAIYGIPEQMPITEDSSTAPINPYGASKLMVEQILADQSRTSKLRTVCLRYFNAGGADPDGEIGECHDPEPHVIPLILSAAAGEIPSIDILGTDYPTPDGTAIRDYIHVCDLADAHVAALRYLEQGGPSQRLNLGTGHGYSVKEIVAAARQVTGMPIAVIEKPRRPGDPPALTANSDKSSRLLGWQPQRSDLATILSDAWRWHQKSASLRHPPNAQGTERPA